MAALLLLGKKVTAEINECVHWLESLGLINHSQKMRVSTFLPTANAIMEMCSANQHT